MYVVCPVKNTRTTIFFCSSVSIRVGKKIQITTLHLYQQTEISTRTNVLLLKINIYIYQNFSSIHNNYQRFEEPKWPIHTVELRKRKAGTPKGKLLFGYIFFVDYFFLFSCILLFLALICIFAHFFHFCIFFLFFSLFPLFFWLFFISCTSSLIFLFLAPFPSFSVFLYNAYLPPCHGDPLRVSLSVFVSIYTICWKKKLFCIVWIN